MVMGVGGKTIDGNDERREVPADGSEEVTANLEPSSSLLD